MEQKMTSEKVKRFILVFLGSLFVQIFCWAMYSYFKLDIWLCGVSAVITALLYHFIQLEEKTGLSRKGVFFAGILVPFVLSAAVTVYQMVKYPQLSLNGALIDGVSPITELISLYAARLIVNGAVLLLFAAADAVYLKNHTPKERRRDEEDKTDRG